MSSASRKMVDECARFCASLSPYVDGELDAAHAVDMEAHVIACGACAERVALIRATRHSMKRTAAERCPAALRARVQASIADEQRRAVIAHGPAEGAASPQAKLIRLRYAVGLAAAAGVVFAMGMHRYAEPAVGSDMPLAGDAPARADLGIDGILDELVQLHAHPYQPDTTDPGELGRFDRRLGVRVQAPAFSPFVVRFQGARLHPVSDRGTMLQLQYAMADASATAADGKHITIYAFNPAVVRVQARRLEQRMVRKRPILVGQLRGYSVAALEQSGVGYAVASDFDTDQSAQMVLAALQQ
jgi:anti-sigma factor RsiW